MSKALGRGRRVGLALAGLSLALVAPDAIAATSRVFVTSTTSDGNLGGLAGADLQCNNLAAAAGLMGDWVAWLSTETVDARKRLGPGSGPFVRAVNTGVEIANDISDLLDAVLENSVSEDEFGANRDNEQVWTGTVPDGTRHSNPTSFSTCSDWQSNAVGDFAVVGKTEETQGEWTDRGGQGCEDATLRFYCFELPPPVRVFVTSTTSDGNLGGLAGADMQCNSLAAAAGLGAGWRAWLSTGTVHARDRLRPGSGPFVRAVNTAIVIADDIPDLLDALLANSVSEDEFGTNRDDEQVWTGTVPNGTRGLNSPIFSTCSDWQSNGAGGVGVVGKTEATDGEWTDRGGQGCEDPTLRMYCFEHGTIFADGFEVSDP